MNLRPWVFLSLLIGCAACCRIAACAQDAGQPRAALVSGQSNGIAYKASYALLIGAGDYENRAWKRLPGVKQDIDAVEAELKTQGFIVTRVTNPTSDQLVRSFKEFIGKTGREADNRLLIYFAGHGHTVTTAFGDRMGYLVPVDAPAPGADDFATVAMPMQQIDIFARQINAKHVLFIFDSCFAGSIFDSETQRGVPSTVWDKVSKPVRQFLTSGSADETVPDKSRFREQLILGIHGEADSNGDGFVTCSELWTYLEDKVVNLSNNTQHPQFGKIRNPNLNSGDFVFIVPGGKRSAAKAPPVPAAPAYRMSDALKRAIELHSGTTGRVDAARAHALFVEASTAGDPLATMWIARETGQGGCNFRKNKDNAGRIARTVIAEVKQLAEAADPNAMFLYGDALLDGLGVPANAGESIIWLRKSAAGGNPNAINELGYACSNGFGLPMDDAQATAYYKRASDLGLAVATANLAENLRDGKGIDRDPAKALELFKSAAERGNPLAIYDLATMYRDGVAGAADLNAAIVWFTKGADLGDDDCMLELARIFKKKRVLAAGPPSPAKTGASAEGAKYQIDTAISWYEKAAEAGNDTAVEELANLFLDGTNGAPKDAKRIIPLFRKAADAGSAVGLEFLGWAYENGKGVAEDKVRASIYYKQAAEKGDGYSKTRLARFYCEGAVLPRDYATAEKYFREAAPEYDDAAVGLGAMFEKGLGVKQSYQQAITWYSKAAYPAGPELEKQTGYEGAQVALARLYETGPAPIHSAAKAVQWYRRAAYLGNRDAMRRLAAIYESRAAGAKDAALAAMWRKNAQGHCERFTVDCDSGGKKQFYVYIVEQYPPKQDDPLKDEEERLLLDHGARVPKEVVESFSKILKVARENNVSYCELCVYALGSEDDDAGKKDAK
ncbi:MAG TPA: DUF2610 domain-containing protein [Chthonomonadaceae bacterium]|nr:DUF2610 domain-containing protein [Chthonomonadaceae bacterium]